MLRVLEGAVREGAIAVQDMADDFAQKRRERQWVKKIWGGDDECSRGAVESLFFGKKTCSAFPERQYAASQTKKRFQLASFLKQWRKSLSRDITLVFAGSYTFNLVNYLIFV